MIKHVIIGLLLLALLVPNRKPTLNELNDEIIRKTMLQPTYLLKLDVQQTELDHQERSLINPQWIDRIEMFTSKEIPLAYQPLASNMLILVHLKKRKVDDCLELFKENNIAL